MKLPSLLVFVLCPEFVAAQEIVALPSGFTPTSLSGDGRVVGGALRLSSGTQPALWTRENGLEILIRNGHPNTDGRVWALNYDGSAAAGLARGNGQNPMRWTRAEGMVLFENINAGGASGYGISDDGRVIVGHGVLNNRSGFVWTADDGLRNLPNNVSGSGSSVSGDGQYFGGNSGQTSLWRWSLDEFSGSRISADASSSCWSKALNQTGDVMVGSFGSPSRAAFLWTQAEFRLLPELTVLNDVSDDGRIAVGKTIENRAAYYSEGLGSVLLSDLLRDTFHMQIGQQRFDEAMGISADGRTITGIGSPSNWVVYLPAARPGDFNGDESTSEEDLISFLDCFTGDSNLPPSAADVNHDRFVDWVDFDEFVANF